MRRLAPLLAFLAGLLPAIALAQPFGFSPGPTSGPLPLGYLSELGPQPSASGPTADISMLTGTPDARMTFTRASAGNQFDASGTLVSAATNVPRFDYGGAPAGITNWLRNSAMAGVAVGNPGTAPTNWSVASSAGLATSIVATGTVNGLPYVDIRFSGTSSGTSIFIVFDGGHPTDPNVSYAESGYFALVGGTAANLVDFNLAYDSSNGGGWLATPVYLTFPLTGTLTRQSAAGATATLSTFATPYLLITCANGAAIDFTIRVAAPQMEKGTTAGAFVPTTGTPATVGSTPLGLLLEDARTNSIRNPRAEGAVIGSPGTLPTNWAAADGTGMTHSIVGVGTENGIPFLDYRFSGTTVGAGNSQILFETTTSTAATLGQVWTASAYPRIVAGSMSGISQTFLVIAEHNSGGTNLGSLTLVITPTTAALGTYRPVNTSTTIQPTIAFVRSRIQISWTGAGPIDLTLRIGGTQIELGNGATSLILPPVSTPGTSTRAVDSATMTLASLGYSSLPASVVVDGMVNQLAGPTTTQGIVVLDDGTVANRIFQRNAVSSGSVVGLYFVASATTALATSGTIAAGTPFRAGMAMAAPRLAASANGSAAVAGVGAAPTGLTTLRLGAGGVGPTSSLDGYVRRLRLWNRLMSDTELRAATQ